MGRPTTKDLARAAGVSLATVDRVLNARAGVRPATVEKVRRAIEEIDFVRDISAANLARGKTYRFLFLLPDHDDEFIDLMISSIDEANRSGVIDRMEADVLRVPANDPHEIACRLDAIEAKECDGVAIMAPESPQVRDAVGRVIARGIGVVALASNQPSAENAVFVGINNIAAGRTVGQLMGRFSGERRGVVLVVTETMQSRDSQERRLGFDQIMARHAPRLRVGPSLETHGDGERTRRIILNAVERERKIAGIYLMHHDIKETMQAIEMAGIQNDVIVIGHELTPHTRACLVSGRMDAVITQDVGHLVRSSIRVLRAKADRMPTVPSQERIRIEITLRENMPEEL